MVARSSKKFDNEWEEEVFNFFDNLEFENLDGGMNCILKYQIDVCFTYQDTIFIVECKSKQKYTRKDKDDLKLKDYIREFTAKKKGIIDAISNHEVYHRYKNKVRFFIATQGYTWKKKSEATSSREEIAYLLAKNNDIWTLDDSFFQHYKSLFDSIGSASKYQLLAEIKIFPRVSDIESDTYAFKTVINGYNVYYFYENPINLLPFCAVARRTMGEDFYQRLLNGNRLANIFDYVTKPTKTFKKGRLIPTNIVLGSFDGRDNINKISLSDKKSLSPELEFGKLVFPRHYGSLWIIDGQHRFFSVTSRLNLDKSIKFLFVLIDGIDLKKQREIFIDVNSEAVTVPSELLWDIAGEAEPDGKKGIISNTVKNIDRICYSFHNKIKIPSRLGANRVTSFTGFCNSIRDLKLTETHLTLDKTKGTKIDNPLYANGSGNRTSKKCSEAISDFFDTLISIFNDSGDENSLILEDYTNFMKQDAGIYIYSSLLSKLIIAKHPKICKNEDFQKLANILKPHLIENFPDRISIKEKIDTGGYSNRNKEVIRLCKILYDEKFPGFGKFENELSYSNIKIGNKVNDLQKYLRWILNDSFSEMFGEKWFLDDDLVDPNIRKSANRPLKIDVDRNEKKYPPYKRWIALGPGEVIKIIEYSQSHKKKGLVKPVLKEIFLFGFSSFSLLNNAVKHLSYVRNPQKKVGHSRMSEVKETDYNLANTFLSCFDKILENYYGENFEDIIDQKEQDYFEIDE
jgi:DGQHR domain-containing protein